MHHRFEAGISPSASSDSKREEEEGGKKSKLGSNEEDSTVSWQGGAKHVHVCEEKNGHREKRRESRYQVQNVRHVVSNISARFCTILHVLQFKKWLQGH